mmetsp:Transcript_307/g.507  ORF Transcript_307/g.507 Transcript_307/m.507 type:complete len:262 (-) Transcript_307:23-808(-)
MLISFLSVITYSTLQSRNVASAFAPSTSFRHPLNVHINGAENPINFVTHSTTVTSLRGIDFDALEDDDECDFVTWEIKRPAGTNLVDSSQGRTVTAVTSEEIPTTTTLRNPNCIELPTANPDISPEEVVTTCMTFLQNNDEPRPNSGLEVCFNFSSDSCRAVNGGSLEAFVQYAKNPVFQAMVDCHKWDVLSVGPEIPGTSTRGAMKTVLVNVVPKKVEGGRVLRDRKFVWTLMKERRPPRQGFWLVHECISVDNTFAMTI